MAPHLLFYQLLLVALVLVCLMVHVWWPDAPRAIPQTPRRPTPLRRKRSPTPKPFLDSSINRFVKPVNRGPQHAPRRRTSPPLVRFTRGRQRTVDTQAHFCPARSVPTMAGADAATSALMGIPVAVPGGSAVCLLPRILLRNPRHALSWQRLLGGAHRARYRVSGRGVGYPRHGTGEIDPNTVLGWLGEAAEHLHAFSAYFLHELHLQSGPTRRALRGGQCGARR